MDSMEVGPAFHLGEVTAASHPSASVRLAAVEALLGVLPEALQAVEALLGIHPEAFQAVGVRLGHKARQARRAPLAL